MPSKAANTPPRSMSPTSRTGASAASATRMLTISPSRRLTSAGLPAPSITTRSKRLLSSSRASTTSGHNPARILRKSAAAKLPRGRPISTTWQRLSVSALSRIGFMTASAGTRAASACMA